MAQDRSQWMREYQREWMRRRRAEWMAGKVCADCGSADRLELDHIDPSQKIHHRIWSWSAKRRLPELAKCQPLCHECHKRKTFLQTWGERKHGEVRMYNHGGCRCDACREAHTMYRRNLKIARLASVSVQ